MVFNGEDFGNPNSPDLSNPVKVSAFNAWKASTGGGAGGVNLDAGINAAATQRAAGTTLLAGQDSRNAGFLDKYTNTIANQGTTEAMATRIGAELGLPELQKNAFNLNQQVLDIPGTYKAGTRGFDVTSNQLSRIIDTKSAELVPLAQRATSQAQFAQEQVGTRVGYAQNDWNRALLPLITEQDFLTDRNARETSMFSEANQGELNAILDKIKNGITLSEGEKNRAQAFSLAEKSYENALKIAQENNKSKSENPFMSIGEGSTIFNTSTGKPMYTAPKSYAPSAYSTGSGW